MSVAYNIIKDEEDYTDAWDNFSLTVSNSWDWDNDDLSLDDYQNYFKQCMVKEGMIDFLSEQSEFVFFKKQSFLTLFLLRWT